MEATAAAAAQNQAYPKLRIGLNQHLAAVVRGSTYAIDLANVVDNSPKLITEPVRVVFHDPTSPQLDFELPASRFVSVDQTGAWVYGVTATPQLRASSLADALATAGEVERRLAATAWRRDSSWAADDQAARAWAATDRAALPIARYAAGPAQLRIVLKRTGAPTPSDRLRGRGSEGFFADVDVTDLSRLDRYEEHVDRRRRALNGDVARPLPVSAFMQDTVAP